MATAFAVYSATDKSLNFYKRDTVPSAGSTFEGKVATAVYTGIETARYTSWGNLPWRQVRTQLEKIVIVDKITPISTSYWFYGCSSLTSLTSLDLSNLDTSNVTDMQYMFSYCSSLSYLDLSNLDTSNVTNMIRMFDNCSSLTSLDLSNFDTRNVTTMTGMFANCSSLTSLDLSSFDTSNVTTIATMFYNCSSLTSLDLSSFDTSNVTYVQQMFVDCSSLRTIYVSEYWSMANVTSSSYMFENCSSLIGDIAFDANYTDGTYATYTGGYLTYKYYLNPNEELIIQAGTLRNIAEAIRAKTGSTDPIVADNFPTAIAAIPTGAKVASGTVTVPNQSGSVTISGIDFSPKTIMFALTDASVSYIHLRLLYVDVENQIIRATAGYGVENSNYDWLTSYTTGKPTYNNGTFTVNVPDPFGSVRMGGVYRWIALG